MLTTDDLKPNLSKQHVGEGIEMLYLYKAMKQVIASASGPLSGRKLIYLTYQEIERKRIFRCYALSIRQAQSKQVELRHRVKVNEIERKLETIVRKFFRSEGAEKFEQLLDEYRPYSHRSGWEKMGRNLAFRCDRLFGSSSVTFQVKPKVLMEFYGSKGSELDFGSLVEKNEVTALDLSRALKNLLRSRPVSEQQYRETEFIGAIFLDAVLEFDFGDCDEKALTDFSLDLVARLGQARMEVLEFDRELFRDLAGRLVHDGSGGRTPLDKEDPAVLKLARDYNDGLWAEGEERTLVVVHMSRERLDSYIWSTLNILEHSNFLPALQRYYLDPID